MISSMTWIGKQWRGWRRCLLQGACLGLLGSAALTMANEPLAGTAPLTMTEPLDKVMVQGIDRFALKAIAAGAKERERYYQRDYSSAEKYQASVDPNRKRFQTWIGAVDERHTANRTFELLGTVTQPSVIAETPAYTIHAVKWQVFDTVTAEGLLLQPKGKAVGRIVAIPDADWTPEVFCGLEAGLEPQAQLPTRLAAQGYQVVVPTLISREDTYSGSPLARYTNQTHREFVYRPAFELGRHVIGYEVQKVQAAIDLFTKLDAEGEKTPIGVAGVGEGGLLALYSAAVDPRIQTAWVCGYFQNRDGAWQEPIYRNVWGLLREFGDAEIASLIAPRALIIEATTVPESAGPPAVRQGRSGGAAPGKIEVCTLGLVRTEFDRAKPHFDKLTATDKLVLVASREGDGPPGSPPALEAFVKLTGGKGLAEDIPTPKPTATAYESATRQKRQFDELVEFTQRLLRRCAGVRDKLWAKADRTNLDTWAKTSGQYRDLVWEEMIGKLPESTMPLNPRTRKVLDEPGYVAYEVVLDVYPDVIASGILCLPKDLKEGEKRPVVVCQHGLEGVPMDTITRTGQGFQYYSGFAHELANRGFITYAPQNPYRGQDLFRTLQRKSNLMKRSLFSYIIPQHKRTLEWLASLPNVDSKRMAFYGLSYGGKTAVRVPPMLDEYCLSICSADYDEWVLKNATTEANYSYVFTGEYEIFEWNMGHVANYAELSTLMTPRPFMVERGHFDGVAPDEWVAWEYAKVERHYDILGIGDKTEIEFFTGPHKINGVATYDFLHRHLNWSKREAGK